ncbi:MAG: catabolite control protein A [Streptococcaceae bacterium]|jgi:LacI family transcriptional regulator|nr:catabolite control protein A [Streptococcaceae bacterium]
MDKSVTIKHVAKESGYSLATVSRVVNGNQNVKPATRKKVVEVIEKLNYRPNAIARGLASKKTTTIGVVIPDIANVFFSSLALGIDDVATMYKYNLIIANSDGIEEKEVNVLNTLLGKQVDGIIFMGHNLNDNIRAEFSRTRTPIVMAGTIDPDAQVASVNIDYTAATKDSTKKLVENGNEKVAFVTGPLIYPINGKERLSGYKQALKEEELEFNEGFVFEANYSFEDGQKVAERVHGSGATAAVVTDDDLAAGLLDGLLELGVKIPEEFEIIASNNSPITKMLRPRLSSISQPLYDLGAVSMRLLTKKMAGEEVEEKSIKLPYRIEKRGSTK